jgi:hypothetical protein
LFETFILAFSQLICDKYIFDGDVAVPRNPELEALVTTDSLVTTERLITLPSVYKTVIGEKKQSRDALSTIFSVFSVFSACHIEPCSQNG